MMGYDPLFALHTHIRSMHCRFSDCVAVADQPGRHTYWHFEHRPLEYRPLCLVLSQVLLSQVHRLRALVLLGRFLDMGSWAVDLALSVGIFPYVLKLLQTTSSDLRSTLVFIWAKILALDKTCQVGFLEECWPHWHTAMACALWDEGAPI